MSRTLGRKGSASCSLSPLQLFILDVVQFKITARGILCH
jgi:hypothetical protein